MKPFGALLISSIIVIGFSLSARAQSSGTDLDQVELMKQFAGTWEAEVNEDTTFTWEMLPFGKGYDVTGYWKAKGETYSTIKSLFGFAKNKKIVSMFHQYQSGWTQIALGEFVSENKLETEFMNFDHSVTLGKWVAVFASPDEFIITYTWKGRAETWVDATVNKYNFTKVK